MSNRAESFFENKEEALKFHQTRRAKVQKIPLLWQWFSSNPALTNKEVDEKLKQEGLAPDGSLVGEIRRSVKRTPKRTYSKRKKKKANNPFEDLPIQSIMRDNEYTTVTFTLGDDRPVVTVHRVETFKV